MMIAPTATSALTIAPDASGETSTGDSYGSGPTIYTAPTSGIGGIGGSDPTGGAVDTHPWIPTRTLTFGDEINTSPPAAPGTPSGPAGGTPSGGTPDGGTPDTPVNNFKDAIDALTGLFSSLGTTKQPQQPRGVAVPIQNTSDSGSGINWGIILLVAVIGGGAWFAYKKGWFGKAKKAATGE